MTNVGNVLTYHSSLYLASYKEIIEEHIYLISVRVSTSNTSKLTMKFPWSKGDKKLDLKPTTATGNDSTDETAIEKKLGMSSVGTYAPSLWLSLGVADKIGSLQVVHHSFPMGKWLLLFL